MASPSHEDHTDLESLFGDGEYQDEAESEPQATQKRSMIQFPRAAVLSQNVGTIAPSSVPSSTEHTHSSGRLSSHSISPAMSTVSKVYSHNNKRDASPGPGPQTKRRRVDMGGRASVDNRKSILENLGLAVGTTNTLTQAKLKSVAGLLAPPTNLPRHAPRSSKGKVNLPVHSNAPTITSGTGTATDPVIIPDEPPSQLSSTIPLGATRRITRSQEAHILLNALPDDPSDVLTQTLRTILKTPTAIPRGRTSISRDTAVYLANGRLTGTPFLRLLRHLASPARSNNPALGLTLLKKLVEAMRATEDATSKSASSAASTPMPATPDTPTTTTFVPHDGSGLNCPTEQVFEPSLFSDVEASAMELGDLPPSTITEVDQTVPMDIVIDPELLALSSNPGYLQPPNASQNFDNFDVDLEELFRALPSGSDNTASTNEPMPMLEPLASDPSIDWGSLAGFPLEDLLAGWAPEEQLFPTDLIQSGQTLSTPISGIQEPEQSTRSISEQELKQQATSAGTTRIPTRAEAAALLERARARKKELEQKLLAARRQLWGCKIEAGVERNVLEALKRER
ncbi:unnamed protein product [Rhizoctonia solani]|uniref:Uncharacterized protein n=1 Tax=Rhizoctonia solani TaxID=456999 RepID=A0A8H2XPC4_9AGAM|nr:unnamed protein product [Rhizoctonia solani]